MTQLSGVLAHRRIVSLVVAAVLAAAALAMFVGPGPLAVPLAIIVLTLPGLALVRLVRLGDPAMDILLGTALSASLVGIVALVQIAAHAWDPRAAVGTLLLVGIGAASLDLATRRRARSARLAEPEVPEVVARPRKPRKPEVPEVVAKPEVPEVVAEPEVPEVVAEPEVPEVV
ncbi:MAG: hypothetical protein MUQ32_00725, partial [Chloroflexi bacterium]|nr:hypothetical protein [Chloroflexota bacterium]